MRWLSTALLAWSGAALHVTYYDAPMAGSTAAPDGDGLRLELTAEDFPAEGTSQHTFCRALRKSAVKGNQAEFDCTVYNATGSIQHSFINLKEDATLFVVPKGQNFVWPTIAIGHNATVWDITASSGRAGSGWSGWIRDSLMRMFGGADKELPPVRLETISEHPRIFRIHNFITDEDIDELIATANSKKLERSTGGLQKKGNSAQNAGVVSSSRTSSNSWDTHSPLAMMIKKRSMDLLRMDWEPRNAGGLQMVRYEPGQFYVSHQDWFPVDMETDNKWDFNPLTGGVNRFATVFFYLSDVEAGGATVFPKASLHNQEDASTQKSDYALRDGLPDRLRPGSEAYRMVETCRTKLHVTPRKGEAILFYHMDRTGVMDIQALHGACPVLAGEKWGANLWLWNGPVYSPDIAPMHKNVVMAVAFVNTLTVPAEVFWIDDSASPKRKTLAVLAPGAHYDSNTYLGHKFLAVVEAGSRNERKQTFRITAGVVRYRLREERMKRKHREEL